jgi:hypothetical protein
MHFKSEWKQNPKGYKIDDTIEHDGDTWKIIGIGWTRETGVTFLHLASTTRFFAQRNGKRPAMIADWI